MQGNLASGGLPWPRVLALAALHGVLFWASFHPLALFPLAWVAFVPFALVVARGTRTQAYAGGFLAAFLGGGASVFWLTLFGPEPWAGTAIGFGFYGVLMVALARPLVAAGWPATLWFPLVLGAQEFLRGHFAFCAFPWVFLGHSQVPIQPLIQSADLGGAILISMLVAAGNGVVADHFLGAPRRAVAIRGAAVAGVAAALMIYGAVRARSIEIVRGGPRVLAVQGNIPQELKNASERRPNLLLTHYNLTLDGAKGKEVDLVVWPETMVPVDSARGIDPKLPYAALDRSKKIREWFEQIGAVTRAHMLVGSLHAEVRGGVEPIEHNSAFFLSPAGEVLGRYDKMFPAPMSENTPFYKTWRPLHDWLRETFVPPGFSQFEAGEDVPIWEVKGWKIAASVCFDITFPEATNLAVRRGADAIVNVSNYGWFKDSAELDLARVQTIFRAIETRRGVVAVCNGGISSFVDPLGGTVDIERVEPDGFRRRKLIEGTLVRPLETSRARTLFVELGDWPGAAATVITVAAALAQLILRRVRARRQAEAAS